MSEKAPTKEKVMSALLSIAPEYDIARIYIFGSVARGSANDQSDVDLCLETGPTFSLFNAGAFVHSLQKEIGFSVDVVTESSLYPHVRNNMRKERVLAYER